MYIFEKKKKAALLQFFLSFLKGPGINFSVHEIQQSERHCPPWLCTGQFFSLEPLHISLKQCSPLLSLKFISSIFYILHTRLSYTASLTVHKYASIYIMVLRFWMFFLHILTTCLNPFQNNNNNRCQLLILNPILKFIFLLGGKSACKPLRDEKNLFNVYYYLTVYILTSITQTILLKCKPMREK